MSRFKISLVYFCKEKVYRDVRQVAEWLLVLGKPVLGHSSLPVANISSDLHVTRSVPLLKSLPLSLLKVGIQFSFVYLAF